MWGLGIWVALACSSLVGLSLGLVGGGGSILIVPILIYVAGLEPSQAIALSLPIVGATATVGALQQARAGNTHGRSAVVFGMSGMVGAVFGARLTSLVPGPVLLLLFAVLMITVGVRMVLGKGDLVEPQKAECNPLKCGMAGAGVGVLTGFLGVGGGFLIVPALLRYAKMPMRLAIGTSMMIIAANSAAGFLSHWGELQGKTLLVLGFTVFALLGLALGLRLGQKMNPGKLKVAFGGLALSVAAYLLAVNLRPLLALWV